MSLPVDLETVQNTIQIQFADLSLLQRALTHRSYVNEHPQDTLEDNERLEFLGDAVLDFITGDWLYNRFPEMQEGRLTRLRAALVRTETLASFGMQCQIGQALYLGRGEEDSGGRERQANLCRAFEALVGAIYLDKGLEVVREFMLPYLEPSLKHVLANDTDKDAKSRLQEWSQAKLNLTPTYVTVSESGPDHAKLFTVDAVIGDQTYGEGKGRSKQAAEQNAAQAALDNLHDEDIQEYN